MGANHVSSELIKCFCLLQRENLKVVLTLVWEDFQESWQSVQCINLFQTRSKKKNNLRLDVNCICLLKLNSDNKAILQIL